MDSWEKKNLNRIALVCPLLDNLKLNQISSQLKLCFCQEGHTHHNNLEPLILSRYKNTNEIIGL